MERRLEAGESLDVHSVASFFVSRVDTEVDKRLAELGREDLRGIAAVANARAAYMRFKELFLGERFAAPARGRRPGAAPALGLDRREGPALPRDQVRRRRWSAPHTVNTMPMPTLLACAEQLEVTGRHRRPGPDAPSSRRSPTPGIDMGDVTQEAAARRHREVRRAVRQADRRRRADARGHRHRAPAHDRVVDPGRARAGADRARQAGPAPRAWPGASGSTTSRSGAAPACRRSATASAG